MKNAHRLLPALLATIFSAVPSVSFAGTQPYIGEIMMTAANFCPRGWARLDGTLLPIPENTALFSLLGTNYGGDGRANFGLPDMRGRAPIHIGQGPGLSNRKQGDKGGAEKHTLSVAQIPKHKHPLRALPGAANKRAPNGNLLAKPGANKQIYAPGSAGSPVSMNAKAIGETGNNQPHNNMQPFLAVRFCIALEGVYPQR